jgi:phosphatidylserine/phosphatidylglycerophosphate/cardiolipin synthase-like enzyme
MAKPVGRPTIGLGIVFEEDLEDENPTSAFALHLNAIPEGTQVEITLWEMDETDNGGRRTTRSMGKLTGVTARVSANAYESIGLSLDQPLPTKQQVIDGIADAEEKRRAILVALRLRQPDGFAWGYYRLDDKSADKLEGDYWEVRAQLKCAIAGEESKPFSALHRVTRLRKAVPFTQRRAKDNLVGSAPPTYALESTPAGTDTATATSISAGPAQQPKVIDGGPGTYSSGSTSTATSPTPSDSDRGTSTAAATNTATNASTRISTAGDPSPTGKPAVKSARPFAGLPSHVGPLATHPVRTGNHLKLYNDGCDDAVASSGALKDMLQSIREAKHFVFAADWSFHPLFRPSRDGAEAHADEQHSIGALLINKAVAGVTVAIHTWDHTFLMADPQNDTGNECLSALAIKMGLLPNTTGAAPPHTVLPNLYWHKSSRRGPLDYLAASHHQKFLVMDCEGPGGKRGVRAFLGGLDLSKGRFDYHRHPVGPGPNPGMQPEDEPNPPGDGTTWAYAQKWSGVDEWYNAETHDDRRLPRQPWHDVHAKLDGPSAWDYLREFVGRWLAATDGAAADNPIWKTYLSLLDREKFLPMETGLPGGKWSVQVCRSLERDHWSVKVPTRTKRELEGTQHWSDAYGFPWKLDEAREQSILHAYRQGIAQAERFVYVENQYFIGSGRFWGYDGAENDLPERLVRRIVERHRDGLPFHVYIVLPMFPEGDPVSGPMQNLRRLEYETMKWMINSLQGEIGPGWGRYLSFYFLANWRAVPRAQWWPCTSNSAQQNRWLNLKHHQRYMIYVHTKMMIVDDRYLILGSCNLNDRGLLGDGDSEIAISAWPMLSHQDECVKEVQDLRRRLWTEHLDPSPIPSAWLKPESVACVKAMKSRAFQNYNAFRAMTRSGGEGHLCLWNWEVKNGELELREVDENLDRRGERPVRPEPNMCLPDSPYRDFDEAKDEGWTWSGAWSWPPLFLVK